MVSNDTIPIAPPASTRESREQPVQRLLAERYQIEFELGAGGMGTVFAANDLRLNKRVVVKLLNENLRRSEASVRRFHQEAQAASALNHPHIVSVTDTGSDVEGVPFIVMEYLPGETLASILRMRGALPWPWVRECMLQVLDALTAAHGAGIVHRDVKPGNCLCVDYQSLEDRVYVKLLDFGIAKFASRDHDAPITLDGVVLGTLSYLSPEQARGSSVDQRSDIYSAAAVMFELVTGRPPFLGHGPLDILLQHVNDAPPRISDTMASARVPPEAEDVIARALQKLPEHRFQSAHEFALALDACPPDLAPSPNSGEVRARREALAPAPALPVDELEWFELRQLLDKVRRFWLDSVLSRSEFGGIVIDQTRSVEFDRVAGGWEKQYRDLLPRAGAVAPLAETFENLNRTLLIVGEAGCGKTLSLLSLARYLADRAARHASYREPVPVVFNLSSWTSTAGDLSSWLVREFGRKYQIPQRLAQAWIRGHRVVPLLDGLDEVARSERDRCVLAINAFALEQLPPGLVVTCRSQAYDAFGERLQLNGAIRLHPLTGEQVQSFLLRGGERWSPLREAIDRDEALATLARTPLMLNLIARTLGAPGRARALAGSSDVDAVDRLYETYLAELRKRRQAPHATLDVPRTERHLRWLARSMLLHNSTVFRLEELQPNWLRGRGSRLAYVFGTRWLGALLLGLSTFVSFGQSPLDTGAFKTSVAFALRLGLIGSLLFGAGFALAFWFKSRRAPRAKSGSLGQLALAAGLGAVAAALAEPGAKSASTYLIGIELGLAVWVVLGLGRGQRTLESDIRVLDSVRWRAQRLTQALPIVLAGTAVMFLAVSAATDARAGAYVAAIISGIGAVVGGLEAAPPRPNDTPNRGIHRAVRSALVAFALGFGAVAAAFSVSYGLAYGAGVGLSLGTLLGLRFGGFDALCHYGLRLLLSLENQLSPDLAKVFDDGSELSILRKVGGGYLFMHRSLMDHLARLTSGMLLVTALFGLGASGCSRQRPQPGPAVASAAPRALASSPPAAASGRLFTKPRLLIARPPGFAADLASADMNGDGKRDLVVASGNDLSQDPLAILYGPFLAGREPESRTLDKGFHRRLALGSLNPAEDALPDVAVALTSNGKIGDCPTCPSVAVHVSANGGYREPLRIALGAPAADVALGDVDGDGDLDIAAILSDLRTGGKPRAFNVKLLRNDGHGKFEVLAWLGTPELTGLSGQFADEDGDGRLDLLVSQIADHLDATPQWCWVFAGTAGVEAGARLAQAAKPCGSKLASGQALGHVYAVDAEMMGRGRGQPALIATALNNERCRGEGCNMPRALLGRGAPDAIWQSPETGMAAAVSLSDLNRDGAMDLVAAAWNAKPDMSGGPGPVVIYQGDRDSNFREQESLPDLMQTQGLVVDDLDGTGWQATAADFTNLAGGSLLTLPAPTVEGVTRVQRNGRILARGDYNFLPDANWIAFKDELQSSDRIHVEYVISHSADIGVLGLEDSSHLSIYQQ